jgi:hypothetical protein
MTCRRVQLPWLFDTWSDLSGKPRFCSKPAPCPTLSATSNSNSPSCSSSKKRQLRSLLPRDRHGPSSYDPLLNMHCNTTYTSGSNDVYDHTLLSYHTISPYLILPPYIVIHATASAALVSLLCFGVCYVSTRRLLIYVTSLPRWLSLTSLFA